jgi:hypothetical protein
MDVGDQSNLLHELLCSGLHICSVINLGSQRVQIVVSPKAWCTPS